MTGTIRTSLLAAIMTFAAGMLQADVLNLTDGSRIVGTLEELDATEARLSGTFAGDLEVPRETIVSMETEAPVTAQLADGSYLTGRLQPQPEAGLLIHLDGAGGPRPLELAYLNAVYRQDPLVVQRQELAVQVTGNANVGVTVTSGNSETQNLLFDGRMVTRTKRNRYTLSGEFIEEESDDVVIKQNWTALVKYDHFVSEQWFWFNSATFESDEFADLELRSALAAGLGYQFFETDNRSLSVEVGPSYIDENFETAPDESFFGSRWALNFDQKIWDGVSFFHYNEGLLGLEDTDELTVRSRTGFRMNITDRIIARIQTAIDWDRSPPEAAESSDLEHTLSIGYAF